ncbi:hypothetical protein CsatB_022725 [Cannabis sativa]
MGTTPGSTTGSGTNQEKKDPSAFVATPETVNHEGWYADSGASSHITTDSDNLSNKSSYGGYGNKTGNVAGET